MDADIKTDAIDRLVDDLARPIFNLRRARGIINSHPRPDITGPVYKGAVTRAKNAKIEIRKMIANYVIAERKSDAGA